MATQDVAAAMERVKTVLERRPDLGLHDDAPATARWQGGLRVVASHANGAQMATDMPTEFAGTGDQVSPGWLFRAGLASCAATTLAMKAAELGIELTTLEVKATSRSDTRGFLGMQDGQGAIVAAGPCNMQVHVRIAASGVATERLRALVMDSLKCAPISNAVASATPITVEVEVSA